jgi:hypothetical protein
MVVMVITITILGILAPAVRRQIMRSRVNRAARVVAADLYLAQGLSSRAREPVRFLVDSLTRTMDIRLLNDSVLSRRLYGDDGEFKLASVSGAPAQFLVLPSGMTSATATVSLSDGSYVRQVRISRAGQIRILP